jgi:hypothetical protein
MPRFATILVALFLLTAAPRAAAQSDTPPEVAAACRDAVTRFMTALETGDAEALRYYIHADRRVAAQQMGVGALIDCIVSQRELERTMTRKWGVSPATQIAGPATFAKADRALVARAEVQAEGENDALVVLAPNVSPVVLHRSRFERRWRIRLTTIGVLFDGFEHTPTPSSYKRIRHLQSVAEALQSVRRQVEQEKLANPAEARAAIEKLIESAAHRPRGPLAPRAGERR